MGPGGSWTAWPGRRDEQCPIHAARRRHGNAPAPPSPRGPRVPRGCHGYVRRVPAPRAAAPRALEGAGPAGGARPQPRPGAGRDCPFTRPSGTPCLSFPSCKTSGVGRMKLWWVRACVREREQEKVRETQRWSMRSLFGDCCVSVSLRVSGTVCMNMWVHVCTLMWVFHENYLVVWRRSYACVCVCTFSCLCVILSM